jgi:uncharacterized protein
MTDYDKLLDILRSFGGVVVGYSGGVDSTLLAKAATDALGDKALCVLIESCLVPGVELDDAVDTANQLGLNLLRIQVDALAIDKLKENETHRCYHCKKAIFGKVVELAKERGLAVVADGANANDEQDFRPGAEAAAELGVRSPFKELGWNKEKIRSISRDLGLPTWNKPSYACLASRVPYGTRLTPEILARIDAAEDVLRRLGFSQFRVRHHDTIARIELLPIQMERMMMPTMRRTVVAEFKALGYHYVALDLVGYRTGSMNEVL